MIIKHTFFSQQINSGKLDEVESNHAIRVLRLKSGEKIFVVDGKGNRALCELSSENKKQVDYKVISTHTENFNGPEITIAIGLPKSNDRINLFLEKVCEIGIANIIPLITKNSERQNFKLDKMQNTLISALKQSGNLYLPTITEPLKFKDFVSGESPFTDKYIAHCADDASKITLKTSYSGSKKPAILIGPEGDFSAEEVILAKENGFKPVSLGNSRLRTETAGIVACHTFHVLS